MATDFTSLSTPVQIDANRYSAHVPDGWQQGRGAFGGLVLAQLTRAIEHCAAAPDRVLRTLTATLCGPVVPGRVDLTVEALRVGSGTAMLAARAVQGGEVQAHAVAVLGKHRSGSAAAASWVELVAPEMPTWRGVDPLPPMGALGPVFTQHFEYRPTGPLPYSHPEQARAAGWVRMHEPGLARDAAWVIGSIDAWWPAAISRFDGPRPIATVAFMIEIVAPAAGLDPDAPLFHEAHAATVRDGYVTERRLLRGEDGRLLAINEQTFVIIR